MPRGRSTFRQQDVTRALRAAKAAGLEVSGYEVDPATGKIIVRTISGGQPVSTAEIALEEWIAEHARRTARNQSRP
jgi:hypothetical protein